VEKRKIVASSLLLLVILATSLSGCAVSPAAYSGDKKVDPFYTDRVATVRIEMLAEDWEFCMTHPFDEQYVPADFWFDEELIPDVAVRTM
jgi:hypothetical protein